MESRAKPDHPIHGNRHTPAHEPDGRVRIAVAHRDPGPRWPNWLDTCGHRQGSMLLRYVGAKETPPIDTRVVRFAELVG
jgi:hypothetical protein